MDKTNYKILIFDLDGTLYKFKGNSFKDSLMYKKILLNAQKYIKRRIKVNKNVAGKILKRIQNKYGEDISIALEREFKLDRYDYFNKVWDIPAGIYIKKNKKTSKIMRALTKKYKLILLSDAPKVWIKNVLKELNIYNIFKNNILSGEGDRRKGFFNVFDIILEKYKVKPENCLVVGDQEKTDIMPAKKLGMATVFVNSNKKSRIADYNIKNILEINKIIK